MRPTPKKWRPYNEVWLSHNADSAGRLSAWLSSWASALSMIVAKVSHMVHGAQSCVEDQVVTVLTYLVS